MPAPRSPRTCAMLGLANAPRSSEVTTRPRSAPLHCFDLMFVSRSDARIRRSRPARRGEHTRRLRNRRTSVAGGSSPVVKKIGTAGGDRMSPLRRERLSRPRVEPKDDSPVAGGMNRPQGWDDQLPGRVRDPTEITRVASNQYPAVIQDNCRDRQVHLTDVQLQGPQPGRAVDGGLGERKDRPSTEVGNILRQPLIDACEFRAILGLRKSVYQPVRARKSISVTNEVRVELCHQAQYNQYVTIIDLRALSCSSMLMTVIARCGGAIDWIRRPTSRWPLGQSQSVRIKNIKAHHRSGSFSTRRRYVSMAACHSSRSGSPSDHPGTGASGCPMVSTSRLMNSAPTARRSAIRLFSRAMASSRVVPSALRASGSPPLARYPFPGTLSIRTGIRIDHRSPHRGSAHSRMLQHRGWSTQCIPTQSRRSLEKRKISG